MLITAVGVVQNIDQGATFYGSWSRCQLSVEFLETQHIRIHLGLEG